eukprot:1147753-Pelagomonas_calceolata.AAC.2
MDVNGVAGAACWPIKPETPAAEGRITWEFTFHMFLRKLKHRRYTVMEVLGQKDMAMTVGQMPLAHFPFYMVERGELHSTLKASCLHQPAWDAVTGFHFILFFNSFSRSDVWSQAPFLLQLSRPRRQVQLCVEPMKKPSPPATATFCVHYGKPLGCDEEHNRWKKKTSSIFSKSSL